MLKIGLITSKHTDKLFLLPTDVRKLVDKKCVVNFTAGYGKSLNIKDSDYISSGAKTFKNNNLTITNSDIILKISNFSKTQIKKIGPKIAITMSNYTVSVPMIETMMKFNTKALSWECLNKKGEYLFFPLFEQIKGKHLGLEAAYLLNGKAGVGKIAGVVKHAKKAKVGILNVSYSGYEATCQLLALGVDVTVFDGDSNYCNQLSKNAKIINLCNLYGAKLETKSNSYETLTTELPKLDVLVNTTVEPNTKNKKIVSNEMIHSMKQDAILIDGACEQGFGFDCQNKNTSQKKKLITFDNVKVSADKDILELYQQTVSEIISTISVEPLLEIATNASWNLLPEFHSIIICDDGKVVNEQTKKILAI